MDPLTLAFLVGAAFVAAFVDSIVGGGGVISLPALLAVGFPAHLALGTNKLAATGASFMATVRYTQAGVVVLPLALGLIPFAAVGSVLGAAAVLEVEARVVKALVVVVMAAMTVYVLARKHFGKDDRYPGPNATAFALSAAVAVVVGFYDGFLGPGTGSVLLFAFLAIQRFNFVRAAGHGRVLNFTSNLGALVLFAARGEVDYGTGLPMFAAMLAGAYVGSHFGLKHGARWIKPLFLAITLALMARLVWSLL